MKFDWPGWPEGGQERRLNAAGFDVECRPDLVDSLRLKFNIMLVAILLCSGSPRGIARDQVHGYDRRGLGGGFPFEAQVLQPETRLILHPRKAHCTGAMGACRISSEIVSRYWYSTVWRGHIVGGSGLWI
jgi:hypothetical protein